MARAVYGGEMKNKWLALKAYLTDSIRHSNGTSHFQKADWTNHLLAVMAMMDADKAGLTRPVDQVPEFVEPKE